MERHLTLVALFAGVIAALGLIPKLDLSFGVPITAQSLGVMLCGTVLGARYGFLSALLFMILVAIGLPILSAGRGGIAVFFTPSAGFLLAWPVAALATGAFMSVTSISSVTLRALLASIFGGVLVLYVPGIIGLSYSLEKTLFEAFGLVVAFIPGDIAKAAIAGLITGQLVKLRPQSVLSVRD